MLRGRETKQNKLSKFFNNIDNILVIRRKSGAPRSTFWSNVREIKDGRK